MADNKLSNLVIERGRPGRIYDADTLRLLRAVITYVGPLNFVATDEERQQHVFSRNGNGCAATGDGKRKFEGGR